MCRLLATVWTSSEIADDQRDERPTRGSDDMADMSGQVALVTGGVRGIGAAITARLVNRGVTVAAGYSRDTAKAQEFQDGYGDKVSTHQGNIGSNGDCERVIDEVLQRHGRLDILVNNAGITVDRTV